MKLRRFLFAFLISLAAFVFSADAQEIEPFRLWENNVGIPKTWVIGGLSQNEITEVKKRWDEIGESLKTTPNQSAGTYYQSGNRGYYLRWSPEKGFVYVYYYEYFVMDASYGKASITDSGVTFIPEREMENSDVGKLITPTNWVPAMNGKYFVRKESIQSFGNFYGGYKEFNGYPRNWNCECSPFAVRQEKTLAQESPVVSAKYQRFIKKPINGKIISVGKRTVSLTNKSVPEMGKTSATPVTINIGRKNGVTRGMMFLLIGEGDNYLQVLEVKKVGEKTSQAVVIRHTDDKGDEIYRDGWDYDLKKDIYKTFPKLRVGVAITTSPVLAEFDLQ
jgi:hypothetical protein